ncbi:uncharacterized protein LOC127855811 [Dreissena polymorpha]|uniref:uncharacterized protein LOC127855811 n=1 Tax=Dreissena polymorpha TaxID=45954 RepID=UPI002264B1DB|nr:uncharacterized protein LOC127855811 [Dreissena polymorpha]
MACLSSPTFFFLLICLLGKLNGAQESDCFPCACVSKEDNDLYRVDCRSNHNLKGRLPDFKHINESQILSLDMSHCNLVNLSDRTETPFRNYSSLKELYLINTSINSMKNDSATLQSKTFIGLQKLEYLNIAHNEEYPVTNETDSNIFERLISLKKLIMYLTNLIATTPRSGYPGKSLKKLPALEEIWIDGFSIVPFGEEFQHMPNLKIIGISGDLIEPIWDYVDYCSVKNITDGLLFNLPYVTNLSIIHCNVLHICANAFKNMINLRMLDLSMNYELGLDNPFNSFKSLNSDVEVLILDSLKDDRTIECCVTISRNMIESIQQTSLKMISLDDNKISSIDRDVFSLLPKTLEHIRIRRNKFEFGIYMFFCISTNKRQKT